MSIAVDWEPQAGDDVVAWINGREVVINLRGLSAGKWAYQHKDGQGGGRELDPAQILRPAVNAISPTDETGVDLLPAEPEGVAIEGPLTADEAAELETLEAQVRKGLDGFRESYDALIIINERKLYRGQYTSFEQYCREKWEISRASGYERLKAAKVRALLSGMPDTPQPENDRQIRALTQSGLSEEQVRACWQRAVAKAAEEKRRPYGREVELEVDRELYDYQGRQEGDLVWWVEAETEYLRAGEIIRLWDGRAIVRPTDGGGPKQDIPFELGRLGVGEMPGKPHPFGLCTDCKQPRTGPDQCPSCEAIRALRDELETAAAANGHELAGWTVSPNGTQYQAKCKHCSGGAGIFAEQDPPEAALGAKLKERCEFAPRPTRQQVSAEPTREELDHYVRMVQGLPPSALVAEYVSWRDSTDPDTYRWRANAALADIHRRVQAGVDPELLSWCDTHGDAKCRNCAAAARVAAMSEVAGVPAGAMQTAAGLAPAAPADTAAVAQEPDEEEQGLPGYADVEAKVADDLASGRAFVHPMAEGAMLVLPPVTSSTPDVPAPTPAPVAASSTPEPAPPEKPGALLSAVEKVSQRAEAAGQAPTVAPTTIGAAVLEAPMVMSPVPTDVRDWVQSDGLTVGRFLARVKELAYNRGLGAAELLTSLEG